MAADLQVRSERIHCGACKSRSHTKLEREKIKGKESSLSLSTELSTFHVAVLHSVPCQKHYSVALLLIFGDRNTSLLHNDQKSIAIA